MNQLLCAHAYDFKVPEHHSRRWLYRMDLHWHLAHRLYTSSSSARSKSEGTALPSTFAALVHLLRHHIQHTDHSYSGLHKLHVGLLTSP